MASSPKKIPHTCKGPLQTEESRCPSLTIPWGRAGDLNGHHSPCCGCIIQRCAWCSSRDFAVFAARPQPRSKARSAADGATVADAHSATYAASGEQWDGESSGAEETTYHSINYVGGISPLLRHSHCCCSRYLSSNAKIPSRPLTARHGLASKRISVAASCPGMEPAVGVPAESGIARTDQDFDSLMTMLRPQPSGKQPVPLP